MCFDEQHLAARKEQYHGNKVNHGEHYLYTEEFLSAIDENLKAKIGS
jgi:hypothetical protein